MVTCAGENTSRLRDNFESYRMSSQIWQFEIYKEQQSFIISLLFVWNNFTETEILQTLETVLCLTAIEDRLQRHIEGIHMGIHLLST